MGDWWGEAEGPGREVGGGRGLWGCDGQVREAGSGAGGHSVSCSGLGG